MEADQNKVFTGDTLVTIEAMVSSALYAHRVDGTGALSTGESLAAALMLNRADWLEQMGYTIVGALDRLGKDWANALPEATRVVMGELERRALALEKD